MMLLHDLQQLAHAHHEEYLGVVHEPHDQTVVLSGNVSNAVGDHLSEHKLHLLVHQRQSRCHQMHLHHLR